MRGVQSQTDICAICFPAELGSAWILDRCRHGIHNVSLAKPSRINQTAFRGFSRVTGKLVIQ
jgi:hypothetical protein